MLGVYSTITLDTERRQKEVAIRKVNGAGLKQIILLFARLYIKLLTVSAIIAFPLIYIVIQIWKKAYIVFFNDGIIYWAGIFIGITFITALTVLFRILGIARINPAEVIKTNNFIKYKIMIKTVNLQKIFKTEEVETWALNNVNLEIKAGEFVAIMGPSGCGKSTLLNILGLLDNPTEGTYELNGTDVSKFTEAQRTNLRKGVIGFVFQSFNLIDELNVFENIELPLLYMGIPAAERKRRVEDAMNRMAIAHRVKHFHNNYPADSNNVLQ